MIKSEKIPNPAIIRFGEQVSRARHAKKMTQQELADQLGITSKSVSYIERGANYPSPENIFRLAHVLDMSLDELVFGESRFQGELILSELNDRLATLEPEDREALISAIALIADRLHRKHTHNYPSDSEL